MFLRARSATVYTGSSVTAMRLQARAAQHVGNKDAETVAVYIRVTCGNLFEKLLRIDPYM